LNIGVKATGALAKGSKVSYLDIVRLLLDAGIDANETVGRRSPLVSAISLEHTAMFNLLLERGADLSEDKAKRCVRKAKAKAQGLESMLRLLEERGVDVGSSHTI
jgi:ankyrin repeat protein